MVKPGLKAAALDVGVVETATLTDDLTHVEIKARLNSGMEKLLHQDTVFWVVNRRSDVKGLAGLARCYPALYRAAAGNERLGCCAVPAAGLAAAGFGRMRRVSVSCWKATKPASSLRAIRCSFAAIGSGRLKPAPSIRKSVILPISCSSTRRNDRLVTTNVRFWKDSGIAVDLTSAGNAGGNGIAVDAVWRRGEL
ncbi:paraquat-inducible protein B [Raoultella terrigena]|uniref:Paraquat-inducible protein B n=1 Tax=Raoultella terrigena TaxID=577 RepID=A0A4V6J2U7_RAOTE|nr:paraquat-inducible protein B [Raoultella terrigena]